MRNLLAISVAILLGAVVAGMVSTRLSYLRGPTVIGQYDREPITGPVSLRVPKWQGVVRYRVPDDWPVAAGQMRRHEVLVNSARAVGSDVLLKLSRTAPDEAMEWSFTGFWLKPVLVVFLGSAVLLCCASLVPGPAGRSREPKRRDKFFLRARASPRAKRIGAGIAIAVFVSFFIYPRGMLLVLGPLFFVFSALGVVELLYRMVRRLGFGPGSGLGGSTPRAGVTGLAVDLLQMASLAVVLAGFCAVSTLALARGLEGWTANAWSSPAFNTLRTLPWLAQDFDEALCDAAERHDAAATAWLVEQGARARTVCAAGTPPVTPAMRFDHPALPVTAIELDALLLAALRSAEADLDQVRRLLARGASPDAQRDGEAALVAAASNFHDDAVTLLLDAGADPNHPTRHGNTALTEIANLDRPDKALQYLPWLVARGGNLDHPIEQGRSILLQRCAEFRTTDMEFLEALLDLGANPNLKDASGRTALDYLREQRADDAVTVFEAHAARRAAPRQSPRIP